MLHEYFIENLTYELMIVDFQEKKEFLFSVKQFHFITL